jgi:hypothetical protein
LLPHLTLGRVKMPGAGIDWPKILQSGEIKNASSHVDRVTLYRSELSRPLDRLRGGLSGVEGQYGPHYTELVSAPLLAP